MENPEHNIDEIVISRAEYERFQHALDFCFFVSYLDKPMGKIIRPTISLQQLINQSRIIIEENKNEVE